MIIYLAPLYNIVCYQLNWLFPSANEDIVVSEPQNPIAIKRGYFVSKFQSEDRMENIPRMKLPIIFTASTLIGSVLANNIGEDTILYRRNAPANDPTDRNTTSSIPLIATSTFAISYS